MKIYYSPSAHKIFIFFLKSAMAAETATDYASVSFVQMLSFLPPSPFGLSCYKPSRKILFAFLCVCVLRFNLNVCLTDIFKDFNNVHVCLTDIFRRLVQCFSGFTWFSRCLCLLDIPQKYSKYSSDCFT